MTPRKMDPKFQILPPLKRFRLMEQQENQNCHESEATSLSLPAKKRKESRDPPLLPEVAVAAAATETYCLPAKKRIWALQPDFIPRKPLWDLDLNVQYNPLFEEEVGAEREEKEIPFENDSNQSIELAQEEENDSDAKEEEDDGIVCAICQSTDGDPSDPIVFCDGCDLMVHTSCYGNPLIKNIPEGDWFCAQCIASKSSQIDQNQNPQVGFSSCCLCPIQKGAMKPTNDGRWAHLVCAVLVPEVFFEDPEGREGIDCSKVPKRRHKEKCYVCGNAGGCVIGCSEPKCSLGFHVTCGLQEDLCFEYKERRNKGAIVAGFCKDHTELWKKQQNTGKFKIAAREEHN